MVDNPRTEFQSTGVQDEAKTRDQLVEELVAMRQRVANLEAELQAVQKPGQASTTQANLEDSPVQAADIQGEISQQPFSQQLSQVPLNRSIDGERQQIETWLVNILNSAIASIVRFRALDAQTWQPEYYSAGSEVVYGYSPQDLMTNPNLWSSRVLPEDFNTIILPVFKNIFSQEKITVEYRFLHRNGSLRWISSTYTAEQHPLANCWFITVVNVDITNLKQVEVALRDSEARFRQLAEHLDAVFWIVSSKNQALYISPAYETIFGEASDRLYCRPKSFLRLVHRLDRKLLNTVLKQLSRGENAEVEYRIRRSDGAVRWIHTRAFPVYNQVGQVYRYAGISQDITQRKQAEWHLQNALKREQDAIERERFIAKIAQTIRQFLDLNQILTTTVSEVRRFLQIERVVIYQFRPDWSGRIVAESVSNPEFSLIDRVIHDSCFAESMIHHYRQGRIHWINDVSVGELQPCYHELLSGLNVQAALIIPILVKQELWGLLAAHHCTGPRQWQEFNWLLLQQLSTQLAIGIHQAELYQQIWQQAKREQALSQVIQDIRNSLDLNTIFATATSEVGQLLQLDRAEIVQYLPQQCLWLNVFSYRRTSNLPIALGMRISDDNNEFADRLKRGEVVRVVRYSDEADPTDQPFVQNFPGSWLLVPLEVGGLLWGSLSLNHGNPPWHWHDWEVDLACAVANQLAIAIQQSELYTEIQELNEDLERLVEFRTAQFQQALEFEALLKRITDRVRDSLDEQQILQSAVAELTYGFKLLGCDTALYDLEQQSATVCFEHIQSELPSAKGRTVSMANLADVYAQLLKGQPTQFCHPRTHSQPPSVPKYGFAILACPMIDDSKVIGDMWLFKPGDARFDALEIRLAQQVASQCAIALRQSRLYQAAQAQVEELERLNRLKDDFLSTVSHELRTPISSIKMATQMLEILIFGEEQGEVGDAEEQETQESTEMLPSSTFCLTSLPDFQKMHRYFHILRDECDREIRLINDLLDLSRLDAGTEPLLLTAINPKIWIPYVAESFVELAHSQQQQLEFNLPDDLPEITTDLSDLERVLTELLNNACKYTPAGNQIIISAHVALPASLLLSITNTGVEIADCERELIFEKFYRIPNNDPWKYGGTGLGLALVKKILNRLNGSIAVESKSGRTTFTVSLPL